MATASVGPAIFAPALPARRLLPLAMLLVPLIMLAGGGWLSWRATWATARQELAQAAGAVAQYGARAVEAYALGAGLINDHLRGLDDSQIRADEARLSAEMQRLILDLPQAALAYVVDRHGIPVISTELVPVPQGSLRDRDYFQALSAARAPAVFVSPIFLGRFDGRLLFTVSRRRTGSGNLPVPDGFDGVVLLSLDPGVAAQSLQQMQWGRADRLAILGPGGQTVLDSRWVGQPEDPSLVDVRIWGQALQGARLFETRLTDGADMLVALRPVGAFGVFAAAMRPRGEIIRRWRDEMAAYLIFGVPATLMLLWLSLRLRREQLRLDRLNAGLTSDLERGEDRLSRARRFGLVGTFEYDLRTGLSRRSPEFMAVQGMPPIPVEERHADWLRRLHPDDRERAERYLLHTLSPASTATEYGQSYRIVDQNGETRWIAARGEINRDDTGRAVLLRGAHVDVTPLRTTELALAESDARLRLAQEAVGIGTFEWDPPSRQWDWSRTMLELWGLDPAGAPPSPADAMSRIHPEDLPGLRRALVAAANSGRLRVEFRLLRPDAEGATQTVWLAARGRRLAGGPGKLLGVAYDITDRKQADQHSRLLAHEVEHRAKNVLAVVLGLLRATTAPSVDTFVKTFEGRVGALARTLSLLGERRWLGAGLHELLRHELAPFDDGAGRVVLDGPAVTLSPEVAEPLSMALHELATNAAKYGALSVPGGRLAVRWSVLEGLASLRWEERGGPVITSPPAREGFGSTLIQHGFRDGVGKISLDWHREGLVCNMCFATPPARNTA